jgi:ATP-dependent RNA helicase DHX36
MRTRTSRGLGNPKIILMSATIDTDLFATFFSQSEDNRLPLQVATINVPGRTFPVTRKYLGDVMPTLLQNYDAAELSALLNSNQDTRKFLEIEHALATNVTPKSMLDAEGIEALCPVSLITAVAAHIVHTSQYGDILVFLPGLTAIERTAEALEYRKPLGVDFSAKSKYKI